MITLSVPEDMTLVSDTCLSDDIWEGSSWDGAEKPDFIEDDGRVLWLEAYSDGTFIGCFCLTVWSSTIVELHTAILKPYRGKLTQEAFKELCEWLKLYTPYSKIITRVPQFNTKAYAAAVRAGFSTEATIEDSFAKFGKLWPEYIMGVKLCR